MGCLATKRILHDSRDPHSRPSNFKRSVILYKTTIDIGNIIQGSEDYKTYGMLSNQKHFR